MRRLVVTGGRESDAEGNIPVAGFGHALWPLCRRRLSINAADTNTEVTKLWTTSR